MFRLWEAKSWGHHLNFKETEALTPKANTSLGKTTHSTLLEILGNTDHILCNSTAWRLSFPVASYKGLCRRMASLDDRLAEALQNAVSSDLQVTLKCSGGRLRDRKGRRQREKWERSVTQMKRHGYCPYCSRNCCKGFIIIQNKVEKEKQTRLEFQLIFTYCLGRE